MRRIKIKYNTNCKNTKIDYIIKNKNQQNG